jgi:hypothetical protein
VSVAVGLEEGKAMSKWLVGTLVTAGSLALGAPAAAEVVDLATEVGTVREPILVLHATDFAPASRDDLAEAKPLVTAVYRQAGVRAVWTDGAAATAQPDGAFHVDVVLLSKDMVAKWSQSDGISEQVLGLAARPKRAYIFYDRVVHHATVTRVTVAVLLGAVIAHEVGHLLLPAFSHSSSGVMRASWEGRLVHMPSFTNDQVTLIRHQLATDSVNQPRP